jgi:hypothetical protein
MPVVSKAQNAAMHAAKEGNSTLGIPQSVGEEFTAGQQPGALQGLPERVKKKAKKKSNKKPKRSQRNGQISERAAARMMSKKSEDYGGKDDMNIPGATA